MKYPFETVRQVYLRQFIVQLNDVVINTPQATIKKNPDIKNINNSFHPLHMSLFPNYILYRNFKAEYQPDDDFFIKKASSILFTMILE